MDVYQPDPSVDTVEEIAPLILFGVTGTFFPAYANSGFTGERNDSAVVEIATRFATMGYVVAVVQYRRGWIPTGSEIASAKNYSCKLLTEGSRICVMPPVTFRWSVEEDYQPIMEIDIDRIAAGGTGTGVDMSPMG